MQKEHRNFVKSYASHLNSQDVPNSNRSENAASNDRGDKEHADPGIVVQSQDLQVDLQSDQEPPSFRIIRKFDKP